MLILLDSFFSPSYSKVDRYIGIDAIYHIPRDITWHFEYTGRELFAVEKKLFDSSKKQPSYTFEDMVQRVFKARNGSMTEDSVRILLRRGARPDPEKPGFFQFSHDLKTSISSMFGRTSYEESLRVAEKIKCPVCIIKGEPGEDYEPRENFLKMVDTLKRHNGRVSYHLVAGAHHLHLNEPQKVAPIISGFLNNAFS